MKHLLAVTAVIALAWSAGSSAADARWRQLKTGTYTVLSSTGDLDTLAWAREFDQFIVSTATLLAINPKALPPMTVILFRHDKEYDPYRLMGPDGKPSKVAGQFVRRPTWSVIGLAQTSEDAYTRRIIFHEGTHWLMSSDPSRHPPWFSEGIAELFSTFERRGDKVNWAKPLGEHLQFINSRADIPMRELLTQDNALSERSDHTSRFYAQSWAFMHMMLMSKDTSRRAQLTQLLQAWRKNSAEAAIQQVFGDDLGDLEKAFGQYVRQARFGYIVHDLKPTPELPPLSDAQPAIVESALGALALGSERQALARQHAAQSIVLDPSQPRGYELLAYIAAEEDRTDEMMKHAENALRRGSQDPDMFMMMGDSFRSGPNSELKDAAVRRLRLYQNAINLNPRRLVAYERLIDALRDVEAPTEKDGEFLELGRRAFPDNDWIKVGVAMVAWKRGLHDQAQSQLDALLQTGGTLDESERQYVVNMRRNWQLQRFRDDITAAIDKRDTVAEKALLEQLLAITELPPELQRYAEGRLRELGTSTPRPR